MNQYAEHGLQEARVLITEFFTEFGEGAVETAIRCYRLANDLEAMGYLEEAERLRVRIQVLVDEGKLKLTHDAIDHAKKLLQVFLGIAIPKLGKGLL